MASRLSGTRLAVLTAVTAVAGAAAGCGIAPSAAEDRGERLQAVAPVGDQVKAVPQPTAGSPENLIRDFLMATVGGGEPAVAQARAFLTPNGVQTWTGPANPQNPDLTVIHIVNGPVVGVETGSRFPVTVEYQVVGQLNTKGRVDELSRSAGGVMTFWVVRAPDNRSSLRIDEIQNAPSGLFISDVALTEVYRIQPVYYWDANYKQLIPDLRYLPLTLTEVQRANQLVQWLVGGPSPWLTGAARELPSGTAPQPVVLRDGKYVVNLNAAATAGGAETTEHLLHQLQWTLSNGSNRALVELQIDGRTQDGGTADAFRQYNQAWASREVRPRFDIVDQRVVPVGGAPAPAVLASADNKEVYRASISRDETVLALVKLRPNGQRYLQIVKADGAPLSVNLASFDMSRPSFVPGGTATQVVVASGGLLHLVSTDTGDVRNITPSRVDDVTVAVASPDGRRIAFIAGGQAYVSSLVVNGDTLAVGSNPRPLLADRVNATGITWLNETWLNVGGTERAAPAMWRVSADGVVTRNESGDLRGLAVTDVVAAPRWPATEYAEVIIYTLSGPYLFSTSTTQTGQQFPFFGG